MGLTFLLGLSLRFRVQGKGLWVEGRGYIWHVGMPPLTRLVVDITARRVRTARVSILEVMPSRRSKCLAYGAPLVGFFGSSLSSRYSV